jgi:hypothetical protein
VRGVLGEQRGAAVANGRLDLRDEDASLPI